FFFQAEDGIRDFHVTGVQTCALPILTFPVEALAEGVNRLLELFDRHGYTEAIIFGHALEGNLHFVFTQGFDDPAQVARYEAFMRSEERRVGKECRCWGIAER